MEILIQVINFLDKHSGSLTFLITAVYVIATILICRANIRAANATREQVEESKRQFEETQRLQIMPFLQIEIRNTSSFDLTLDLNVDSFGSVVVYDTCTVLKNVGLGTATNIIYSWEIWENSFSDSGEFPINAVQQGDSYSLLILMNGEENCNIPRNAALTLEYMDMLGKSYKQRFLFDFGDSCESGSGSTLTIATDPPNYAGAVTYKLKGNSDNA
ncbi:MAG: hypothetical protein HFG45_09750 [Oscillospiraceae bacterium]|nr:hypothetical protein [Oscillospiraceae bacterium]